MTTHSDPNSLVVLRRNIVIATFSPGLYSAWAWLSLKAPIHHQKGSIKNLVQLFPSTRRRSVAWPSSSETFRSVQQKSHSASQVFTFWVIAVYHFDIYDSNAISSNRPLSGQSSGSAAFLSAQISSFCHQSEAESWKKKKKSDLNSKTADRQVCRPLC